MTKIYLGLLALGLTTSASTSHAFVSPSDLQITAAADLNYCSGLQTKLSPVIPGQSLPDDGTVWRVGSNRWDQSWEDKYSTWVSTQVDEEFFLRSKISTDCADAAVALRMIFSRIHHLPVYLQDDDRSYSHTTKKWAKFATVRVWTEANWLQSIQKDARFLAFLAEVTDNVGTANLAQSTYPVRLSDPVNSKRLSSQVTPGTVLLSGGHTRFISRIDSTGYVPIEQMDSTVPAEVRTLHRGPIAIWGIPSEIRQDGVIKFNWPVNCGAKMALVADDKMPGYSDEQYKIRDVTDLNTYLTSLVPGKRKPYDKGYVDIEMRELKSLISRRIDVVNRAQVILARNPKAFDNPKTYDDYSTEHRDEGIVNYYKHLTFLLYDEEENYLIEQAKQMMIPISPGKQTSLYFFIEAVESSEASPNPAASREERWGYKTLERELGNLVTQREELVASIPDEIKNLGPIDRLQYELGRYSLDAHKKIKQTDVEIAKLKRMMGR